MRHSSLSCQPLAFFLLILAPSVHAADDARAWLMKMNQAAHTLNYSGSFVYQHGDQLESMRILRKVQGGLVRERLMSLNGAAREVIRTDQEVRCYLPDENTVVVEHRRAEARSFPSLLPQSLRNLDKNYAIALGHSARVVDRDAQEVMISPRDNYRYGYQLWADKESGLLLKANLVDDKGKVIEQFMFTSVELGGTIPDSAFEPRDAGKGYVWYREDKASAASTGAGKEWEVKRLPPGFTLSMHMTRKIPNRKTPVEHMIYSDGLAVVSVFVEKLENEQPASGNAGDVMNIGAVHARGVNIGTHQVTVVGEVPVITVDLIGESVARLP
jgi:sigma-E factor negative regulatory protein RseB